MTKILLFISLLLSSWVAHSQTMKSIQFVDVKNNVPIQFVQIILGENGYTANAFNPVIISKKNHYRLIGNDLNKLILKTNNVLAKLKEAIKENN